MSTKRVVPVTRSLVLDGSCRRVIGQLLTVKIEGEFHVNASNLVELKFFAQRAMRSNGDIRSVAFQKLY